jgi:hypothetical protein
MIDEKFVILAAVINLIGSTNYVINTIKGKTQPNRVTWFLWALAPLIAFGAMIDKGVGLSALMTFMVGFGPLMVFIASFVNKKSVWKITRFDLTCGALSLGGLGLWLLTKEGDVAIFFSIIADALALLPTLVKSWKAPETESSLIFLNGSISAVITLLTLNTFTFAYYGFPLYILAACLLLFVVIKFQVGKHFTAVSKTQQ